MNRHPLLVAAFVLGLAACGGGGDEPTDAELDAQIDAQIDAAMDDILDVADSIVEPEPEPDAEPESDIEPEPESEPEPGPGDDEARCATMFGDASDAEFTEVDCASPHDAEFAAVVAAPEVPADASDVEADIARTVACLEATEALAGQSLREYGPEVAYAVDESAGELECWLRSAAYGSLTGSLRDVDLATALGDFVTLASIQPGECFLPAPENSGSISIGTKVDCSTERADQILGTITVDDGPFPGTDALFALIGERCPALAAAASFEVVGDTTSGIAMFETEWEAYGIRDLLCTSYRAAESAFCTRADPEGDEDLFDDPTPCGEPHDAEFAGFVPPPVDLLPDDADEAGTLLRRACVEAVEQLAGRSPSTPGVGVGFYVDGALGEPINGDVECYAEGDGTDLLVGSMLVGGIDAAYGDVKVVADLEPGTCFTFAGDALNVGLVVECSSPDSLMVIGSFVADPGPYPGSDALRAVRTERCGAILADTGLAADPATVSGTFPGEQTWTALDQRLVTCDATPL